MPKEIYIDENGNERILSSSPSALSGLLDTDITTPTQPNQVLAYDSNGKVVNTYPCNYSTTEKVVGTWIDGSLVYEKVIDLGALPNATSKNVNHNISNLKYFVKIEGIAYWSGTVYINLPYIAASNPIYIAVNSTSVTVTSTSDRRDFNGYVTLRYIKTS